MRLIDSHSGSVYLHSACFACSVWGGGGGPLINIPSGPILSLSTVVRIVTGPKMLDLS